MSARSLVPFTFDGREIRVAANENGDPQFVGKDICEALGYANAADAIARHCKGVVKRYPLQTAGGMQDLRVLGEADVLRLIVSSTLPAAQEFERLVFEEILPTIRSTGSYTALAADPLAGLPPEQRALVSVMLDQAAIKQQLAVHDAALATVDHRVDEIAAGQALLTRPSAAESIVHIRKRIGDLYGLPARIIDEVVRQSPYALKPVMVKNSHEEALGGSYACFWIKDVSAVFARFAGECQRATATQATHPFISGRFKLVRPHEVGERPAGKADPTSGTQANLSY